jgi:hypothetical protein
MCPQTAPLAITLNYLDMNGATVNRQGGFFDGLIQSWMTMTGASNIFG